MLAASKRVRKINYSIEVEASEHRVLKFGLRPFLINVFGFVNFYSIKSFVLGTKNPDS